MDTVQLKKLEKLEPLAQKPIHLPHVGELVYYPGMYPGLEELTKSYFGERMCDLSYLKPEQLKALLPPEVRMPTLAEDNLIRAYTSSYKTVVVDTGFGHFSFYGKEDGEGSYKRLFFELEENNGLKNNSIIANVDLAILTQASHYVDTQLGNVKAATKKDFEQALEEQGLEPGRYKFDEGVMACVFENGTFKERIYVASGVHTRVLHKKYGTPLVTEDYSPALLIEDFNNKRTHVAIDLKASGFPEELSSEVIHLTNSRLFCHVSRKHFELVPKGKGHYSPINFFISYGHMFDFPYFPKYPEEDGIIADPIGLYMLSGNKSSPATG